MVPDDNIAIYRYAYLHCYLISVLKGPAVTFSESRNEIRSPPPILGQHTKEVLKAELGLDDHSIDNLHKENIIYSAERN